MDETRVYDKIDELHKLLATQSATMAAQSATMTAIANNLDKHMDADSVKFKDLYEKADRHERFHSRLKGGSAAVTLLGIFAGTMAKMKGWF